MSKSSSNWSPGDDVRHERYFDEDTPRPACALLRGRVSFSGCRPSLSGDAQNQVVAPELEAHRRSRRRCPRSCHESAEPQVHGPAIASFFAKGRRRSHRPPRRVRYPTCRPRQQAALRPRRASTNRGTDDSTKHEEPSQPPQTNSSTPPPGSATHHALRRSSKTPPGHRCLSTVGSYAPRPGVKTTGPHQ